MAMQLNTTYHTIVIMFVLQKLNWIHFSWIITSRNCLNSNVKNWKASHVTIIEEIPPFLPPSFVISTSHLHTLVKAMMWIHASLWCVFVFNPLSLFCAIGCLAVGNSNLVRGINETKRKGWILMKMLDEKLGTDQNSRNARREKKGYP